MTALVRNPVTAIWALLIAMTLVTWWMGTDHGVEDVQVASVLILLLAFFKVRFVGLYFMELREAPVPLRAIFETWCVAVCAAVVVMYLIL